ncbi:uncharacterized protein DUF397 [Murinocardiopsis flavida]|uniref:Uncharacterized protein DUF397 n=1 Tax=Murinocardiopsis flavida TaxID=645275 RepID=A0A2P8CLX5_9ACTN|nr:DUF397 domain-containing protein [Murinocardiopsis flavida]PSK85960.1 uncharacterized protein DUF397 [Murinocardiopsis flavida]
MVDGHVWRKSSYSGGGHQDCVEVADLPGASAVRDTKSPDQEHLLFSAAEWRSFLEGVKREHL